MRLKLFTIVIAATLLSACKKDKPAVVEVTVKLQNGTALDNVAIKLLSDDHKISASYEAEGTSNSAGKIDFNVTPGKTYYLYYGSGNEYIYNTDAAYIITGTYTTQQQINDTPHQVGAKVGDYMYDDINGDGKIDQDDLVLKVVAPHSGTDSITLTLFTGNLM
jgi:hypothetical protein